MVAFSKLSVMVAAPAAANQLFVAPAPYAAAPQARRQRTISSLMCSISCGIGFLFHGSESKCSITPATDVQDRRQNLDTLHMIYFFFRAHSFVRAYSEKTEIACPKSRQPKTYYALVTGILSSEEHVQNGIIPGRGTSRLLASQESLK